MKHITIGILAHVDAGKTTLSECMGKSGDNAPGYTGACGFLCRNGTYLTGTGLCDPGDQWCRWGAGTHAYALETAQKISDTDVHIHQ